MDCSIFGKGPRLLFSLRLVALPVMTCLLLQGSALAQQRTWTDASGHYKIEGELISVTQTENGLQAELLKSDGQKMAILVSKLSKEDEALATTYFNKANGLEAAVEVETEVVAPVKSRFTETSSSETRTSETRISEKRAAPEESVVSRPLRAPIKSAAKKLDNREVSTAEFDPETAFRLTREIKRDRKGRPTENPIYTVEVSDADMKFLPEKYKAIADLLRDPDEPIDKRRRAIDELRESWPEGRHAGLLKVLINALSSDDKFLRIGALDLLANHDSDQSLIYIFARIDDVAFDVRWRTYEILTYLRDPRVIPELVERLGTADRNKAASVLQVFGYTSAPLVTSEWIKTDGEEDVMLSVCQLLGNIGEQDTAEVLKTLESHKSLLVRLQAKNSIKQINRSSSMNVLRQK